MPKNNISEIEKEFKKTKLIALVAPSFASEFKYPSIINQLKSLGFDKVVELTFGAKLVNKEYHKILKKTNQLWISTVCPGIIEAINNQHPELKKNLLQVDSPMIVIAKVCKKYLPAHKTVFISPCHFKKQEAENSKYIDYTIDYQQLNELFKKYNIKESYKKQTFDLFYNDYTKIYPISGGLSKTAHLNGILKPNEYVVLDSILELNEFIKNPPPDIKFVDVTFCKGGCIGGPCLSKTLTLEEKKKRLLQYLSIAKEEKITKKGLIKDAKGLKFTY